MLVTRASRWTWPQLDADLTLLGGLDRYQTLTWEMVHAPEGERLVVQAVEKKYGPPFVYLGLTVENTTANDVRFNFAGRYLAFDVVGSGSEVRLDANVGSDPSIAGTLYRPLGNTPFFIAPFAGVDRQTLNYIEDDHIVASYGQTRSAIGVDVGVNLGRLDDVRLRARVGRLKAIAIVGDPGLPELSGEETVMDLRWAHDGQDSPGGPPSGHSLVGVASALPEVTPAATVLSNDAFNRGRDAG